MIFSKACEYGIRAAIYIAQKSQNNERCSIKDIAWEIDSPEAFTAKILQKLVKAKIVVSVKGATGGFEIPPKEIKKIKLSDIIVAIEGDTNEKKCALGLKKCSELKPCPVHNEFKVIKLQLIKMMHKTTLSQMSVSVNEGFSYLKLN